MRGRNRQDATLCRSDEEDIACAGAVILALVCLLLLFVSLVTGAI